MNIDEPPVRIFWKETNIKRNDLVFPDFFYFKLCDWISEEKMTEEQKDCKENQYYKTTWGILIKYDYKEAFQKSYYSLEKEEKQRQTEQLKALPNFDKDIFFQISWIMIDDEVDEEPQEKIVTDETGKKYKLVPIE